MTEMAAAMLQRQSEAALLRREMRAAVFLAEKALSLAKRASPVDEGLRRRCSFTLARVLFHNTEHMRGETRFFPLLLWRANG